MSIFAKLFGSKPSAPGVTFKEKEITNGNTYEVYKSTSRQSALDFLRQTPVRKERHYLICETPEGAFGKDMVMIFDERTQERIEYGSRGPQPQMKPSITHCSKCGYPVLPVSEGPTRFNGSHGSDTEDVKDTELLKEKGVGFICTTCRSAYCPFCVRLPESPTCPSCQKKMQLLSDVSRLVTPDDSTSAHAVGSETCPNCSHNVAKLIPVTDYLTGKTRRICQDCSGAVSGAVGEVINL
jgi:hypothetical protein